MTAAGRSRPSRPTRPRAHPTPLVPDPVRLARYRQAPEAGPRLLFFSGGNALRTVSRHLIDYTHNSVHLVTPFDSGGSSAELRRAFHMPAVGDLRNRLMALADQTVHGNPEIYTLFAFRFPTDEDAETLRARLDGMVRGTDALVAGVPQPLRGIVRDHLAFFRDAMPEDFDLGGAAIGNLVLTGGYLAQDRNMDSVLHLFSELVQARGIVRPSVDRDLHLVAELEDGRTLVGQHRITGRTEPPIDVPVRRVYLARTGADAAPARPVVAESVTSLIEQADVICFPVGSFYSSLLATLLPGGVADAVARADAPKVYVPNPDGTDPEELGLDLVGKVERLVACLRDGSGDIASSDVLQYVLVDAGSGRVPVSALEAIRRMGVEVIDVRLVTPESAPLYDDRSLADALLSLA